METRILMLSDLHLCHITWDGVSCEDRLARMVEQVNAYTDAHPTEAILMLGDYSLDFWQWSIGGSYLASPPVSNTRRFVEEFVSRLRVPCYLIAGNHEQYGEDTWERLTGCLRQASLRIGPLRVLMLDTFGGNLDPTEHSDGTYTGPDCDFIRSELASDADAEAVLLCAHHFDPAADSEEARELIGGEERIWALFSGHVHHARVEDYQGKPHARDGHFSYAGGDIRRIMWGFREVVYDGTTLKSRYVMPENSLTVNGEPYSYPGGESDAFSVG